jgi:hypothetical protein
LTLDYSWREMILIRFGKWLLRVGMWMLAVCLVVMPALAQNTDAQPPDEPAPPAADANSFSLSGTVLNSVTGEPIRRAAVQVSGQNGKMALTDAGGHFVLEGLAEGNVYLAAMKPGFFGDEASNTTPAVVGKDAPAVVLKLTPSGVISGRVTTKDEQPLEGFPIRIFEKQNVGGRLLWADQPPQARTNDEGEYRVPGLKAGTYYVAVDQSSGTVLSQKGIPNAREQVFTKIFFPSVSEMSAATPIEITPGEEFEANFTLSAEPVYRVSGSLTGAAGGVATLTLERKSGDDSDFTQTLSVQNGKFDAKVPAGAYGVSAETSDGKDLVTPGGVLIRSDEPDLQLPLSARVTIPVEIVREQGGAGSERTVVVQIPGLILQLDSVSQIRRGGIVWGSLQGGGIPNVAPGKYRLQIKTSGGWWVKSARSEGVDLLSDDLPVVEEEKPAPIEITVRDGAGAISGTVTPAGDPLRVLVLLVQRHGSRNIVWETPVMQGNFTIPGVPPGDYAILALDGAVDLEYADPDILEPYLSDAEQVSVPLRGNVTVNLGLTQAKR